MRYYIAGPMSGIPAFNFPAFHAAAAALRAAGYDVVSPAETDPEDVAAAAMASKDGKPMSGVSETWGDALARDVKMLADGVVVAVSPIYEDGTQDVTRASIDGICFLPGWENSKGARVEAFVGLHTGKRFALYDPEAQDATEVPAEFIQHQLALAWADGIAMFSPVK